jgi:hypothetical protein
MPSDQEDEIDTDALKRLDDLQRQKMIDMFGFDPDSRDSAPKKKTKKRTLSEVSDPIISSKKSRTDSNSPSDRTSGSKKLKNPPVTAQATANQRRDEDSDFFAG